MIDGLRRAFVLLHPEVPLGGRVAPRVRSVVQRGLDGRRHGNHHRQRLRPRRPGGWREQTGEGLPRGDRDRRLCEQVRTVEPAQLARQQWPFDDHRLPELLFRYRARNFPDTLSGEEQQRWKLFCQQRLSDPEWGAPNTLEVFNLARQELAVSATPFQCEVLAQWQEYADALAARVSL